MVRTIQRGIYPTFDLCPEPKMFFRSNSQVIIDMNQKNLAFFPCGKVDTSTYFNSLTVHKWKENAPMIEHLFLRIQYRGKLKLIFKLNHLGKGEKILHEVILDSRERQESDLDLPFWPMLRNGMLYFELFALEKSIVYSFSYITDVKPPQTVQLGIVITHFNRQDYIIPAIKRLKALLLQNEEFKNQVQLIVVDNSRNLPEIEGVTIIKNANLGGAGGFARGLIYLQDRSEFTHCLFMDDDASCDVESIKRALVFLEYAHNPKLAISGAMLTEREVYRQYESGAYFHGTCKSVDKGLNMLYLYDLLKNERLKRVDYGAWWFFAFNLKGVDYNAFPYFVRGDDISFSYSNRFKVETMNGICSWQPDFSSKSTPFSVYLDMRNHLMHPLHGFVKGNGIGSILKSAILIYAYHAVSYFYDSAKAVNIAIRDVLKGPDFWRNNVDMIAKRQQINEMIQTEIPVPIPKNIYTEGVMAKVEVYTMVDITDRGRTINLPSIIRYITLNGHLLPSFLFHKKFVWLRKSSGSRMSSDFRYRMAVFLIDNSDKCLILKHDKKKFFSRSFEFVFLLGKLILNYKKLKNLYLKTYPELTSDKFWREQFQKGQEKNN